MTCRILTLLLLLAIAIPAAAQDDPYAACAAMTSDAERLACFDATYSRQQVVIAEQQEQAEEQREEVFGFRESDDATARAAAAAETSVTGTVTEVLQGARRSQVVLLDNGQLWREIDGSTLRNRVRVGWVGTITRHWSGAYEIRFEQGSGYLRVERMR